MDLKILIDFNNIHSKIMKTILYLIVSLVVFTFQGISQPDAANSQAANETLKELVKVSSEIYDAGITGNRPIIEKYFADTYLETDVTGVLHDKAWNLENFLPSNVKLTYKIEEPKIREYGQVAVFYYRWAVHYEHTAPPESGSTKPVVTISDAKLQVTDTFIRTKTGWKIISSSRVRLRD